MNDTELFSLCREVYKRFPEWTDVHQCIWNDSVAEASVQNTSWAIETKYVGYTPLYTSDYLLEKLYKHEIRTRSYNGRSYAEHPSSSIEEHSDTTLKGLLKLVIALDDAGVKLEAR